MEQLIDRLTWQATLPERVCHVDAVPAQADAATIAAYIRGHWSIEALHWLRDVRSLPTSSVA